MDTNPVVRGLLTAFQLKQMMHQQSLQREELERRKARDQRDDELTQRQIETQDLQTRLALSTNPALEAVEPGQASRTVSVGIPEDLQQVLTGSKFQMAVPVENPVQHGGQAYAVRGREELFQDRMRELQALTSIKDHSAIGQIAARHASALELEGIRQGGSNARTLTSIASRESEGEANRGNQAAIAEANRKSGERRAAAGAAATREAAKIRSNAAKTVDVRKEQNARELQISEVTAEHERLAQVLREGGTYEDNGKTINLEPEEKDGRAQISRERQALETKMKGLRRKLRLLRGQSEEADIAGGGTWDEYKKGSR